MSYGESIIKLRARVQDAVVRGLVNKEGKDFLEATLIQVMNDSERQRQNCLTQAENLRRQASVFEGQAGAFGSISSIVFNVINGYVTIAEKDEAERKSAEEEKLESASTSENIVPGPVVKVEEPAKKGRKKKT